MGERFGVSYGWVAKIHTMGLHTGSRSRPPQKSRGRPRGIDDTYVRGLVKRRPDIVLHELRQELLKADTTVSIAHLARVLGRLGLQRKKSLHATERDSEDNRRRREAFVARIGQVAPEDLIYLDESGVSTQMTRMYARAPRGHRVHDTVPGGR